MTLNDIENLIKCCEKCDLCKTRTNIVAGDGNPNAKILFVGEAPGRYEDLQGRTFEGQSGKVLDKLLTNIGLCRKDIYIANILKCRPPENRDPSPSEQEMCMPYLRAQFKLIKPKMVVCLGRIAAQRIIDQNFKITTQHGTFTLKGDTIFTATYHPSAVLRYPENESIAIDDFNKIKNKLSKI